ncbi:MAG: hypothetical protein QXN55_05660 [Candidatus Nitrosotenuis sp.]
MSDGLQKMIIDELSAYGQQGCSVNELFRNLKCSKNDFVQAKNVLIKQRVINATKEGKQKIRLSLNSDYLNELDSSFQYTLKSYEITANDALRRLRKLKPLFEHSDVRSSEKIVNQNVAGLLQTLIGVLEGISHRTMAYTLRCYIDLQAAKSDLRKNQQLSSEMTQNIIKRLIEQHKDEEKEIRNYLLWGTSSSFSYVF